MGDNSKLLGPAWKFKWGGIYKEYIKIISPPLCHPLLESSLCVCICTLARDQTLSFVLPPHTHTHRVFWPCFHQSPVLSLELLRKGGGDCLQEYLGQNRSFHLWSIPVWVPSLRLILQAIVYEESACGMDSSFPCTWFLVFIIQALSLASSWVLLPTVVGVVAVVVESQLFTEGCLDGYYMLTSWHPRE